MSDTVINLVDFSSYKRDFNFVEPSGCSEKMYLQNPDDGTFGLFKYPKSDATYEYVSEHLASVLAAFLGIPCCIIEIGKYNGRIGCFSHWLYELDKGIQFVEGVSLIENAFPDYDKDHFSFDNGDIYSIEKIMPCLYTNAMRESFLMMNVFDFFIGNSDRHHSNWAILHKGGCIDTFSPIYDNGSSLCSYISESKVDLCLTNPASMMSLCDTKSKSAIGLGSIKRPKHSEMIEYIIKEYYAKDFPLLKSFIDNILCVSKIEIDKMLNEYNNLLSEKRIILLENFLIYKQEILSKSVKGGST